MAITALNFWSPMAEGLRHPTHRAHCLLQHKIAFTDWSGPFPPPPTSIPTSGYSFTCPHQNQILPIAMTALLGGACAHELPD